MKKVYLFDFDGTITTKDTLFEFLKFTHGVIHYTINIILLAPVFLAYLFKILTNEKSKQIVFSFFYKNMPIEIFESKCHEFKNVIYNITNKEILEIINDCNTKGIDIIIVSASIENWIIPWATSKGINEVIATKIEYKNNLVTGNFLTKNCNGKEKVNRILKLLQNNSYYVVAYGDSAGDKEMLDLANEGFWVKKNKIMKYEK